MLSFIRSARLLALVLLAAARPAFAQEDPAVLPNPDTSDQAVRYPFMAWDYVWNEEMIESMARCGITYIAFVPERLLDACARHGIKAIVYDPAITGEKWNTPFAADPVIKALPALIARVNDHPAVAGYHLRDEPGPHELAELGRAAAKIRELAPGKWPYINMTPGDGDNYSKFLDDFIRICNPTALSYDRYVIGEGGGFGDGFWTGLELYRQKSLETGLPLWNIVLTAAHWNYREPTPADLRLQVYGSLVYGVDGIGYYKFHSGSLPILDAPDLGNFRGAPLDPFGEETALWTAMRQTNREVHNLAPHLAELTSTRVYHFGEPPAGLSRPDDQALVTALPEPAVPGGLGVFVVGEFKHTDGTPYVMIVNKSLTNSVPCNPTFAESVTAVEHVDAISGNVRPFSPYFYLAPGQGVLLRLTTAAAEPTE